jgi:hypothetical protein
MRRHRRAALFLQPQLIKLEIHEMTTTKLAVAALARHVGLPLKRIRGVAVALTEAGVLPPGSPGHAPELDPEHVVSLLIGSCVETPLRAVGDAVREYRALRPGGVPLQDAPASLRSAGGALDIWADIAVHGDADVLRGDRIEIVTSWPEVAIHTDGRVNRFQPLGTLPGHWQAHGHRKSVIIDGAAFVAALNELFSRN